MQKKKSYDCVISIFNIFHATVTKCLRMGEMLGRCKLIKGQDLLKFKVLWSYLAKQINIEWLNDIHIIIAYGSLQLGTVAAEKKPYSLFPHLTLQNWYEGGVWASRQFYTPHTAFDAF